MTTSPLPEDHDDSPVYQSLIKDSEADLADRLAEGRASGATLIDVYKQLEKSSRDIPNHSQRLMTAILAGEKVIAKLLTEEQTSDVPLSLAALLVRRSRWDEVARWPDLEYAASLMSNILHQTKAKCCHMSAFQGLSAVNEERYLRKKDHQDLHQAQQNLEDAANLAGPVECAFLRASAACLRFKTQFNALKCILDIPLAQIPGNPVTWPIVAHKKFRFIDARSLAAGESLRVFELDALPRKRYVVLSYIWHGYHTEENGPVNSKTMSIEGAIGADVISIDVLSTVGKCVATFDCELLWIDGICIMQNDEEDKAWQIQNMFHLYKNCLQCLILPGGLSRLVPLTEPTPWIHRAWTLQEAVAPDECTVLFAWTHGTCVLQTHMCVQIDEIEPGKAAKASLYFLLGISIKQKVYIFTSPESTYETADTITLRMLIEHDSNNQATALLEAIDYRGQEGLANAVWRASLMRVASRPADAVFSIMGLLDVNLDPLQFDPNDRKGATIALMKALLQRGEQAEWLGVAPTLAPNPEIPTLPRFPVVGPQGKAYTQTENGLVPMAQAMGLMWFRLVGTPFGSMPDDDGTLALRAVVLPIRRQADCGLSVDRDEASEDELELLDARRIRPYGAMDDEDVWYPDPESQGPPYAIKIGKKDWYGNGAVGVLVDPRPWLLMLVDIHERDKEQFANLGYSDLGDELVNTAGWVEREIVIAPTA